MSELLFSRGSRCPICGIDGNNVVFTSQGDEVLRYKNYRLDEMHRAWLHDISFSIMRCNRCDFYYHDLIPTESLSRTLYNDWISLEGSLAKYLNNPMAYLNLMYYLIQAMNHFSSEGNAFSGKTLLDVGCGWGPLLDMGRLLGFKSCGVEYTEKKLSYIQSKGFEAYTPEALPDNLRFDVVSMIQVLEHLPDPLSFVKKYSEKVSPGGVMVIEVPNCHQLALRKWVFEKIGKNIFGAYQPMEHVNCFTPRSLNRLMKMVGWRPLANPKTLISTRLGGYRFVRSAKNKLATMLLGSTGRVFVRDA